MLAQYWSPNAITLDLVLFFFSLFSSFLFSLFFFLFPPPFFLGGSLKDGGGVTKVSFNSNNDSATLCKSDHDHRAAMPGTDAESCYSLTRPGTSSALRLLCYHDGSEPLCPVNATTADIDSTGGENLLLNPKLEAPAWQLSVSNPVYPDDESGLDTGSLRFDAQLKSSGYIYNYRDHAPMEPNTTYTLKVWVRTTADGGSIKAYTCTCCETGTPVT